MTFVSKTAQVYYLTFNPRLIPEYTLMIKKKLLVINKIESLTQMFMDGTGLPTLVHSD